MIQRELKPYTVLTYDDELDDYGQPRQGTPTERTVEMVVKLFSNQIVENPLFNDVELIGITKDQTINDSNKIIIGGKTYDVVYVVPSGRYCQIFLRR